MSPVSRGPGLATSDTAVWIGQELTAGSCAGKLWERWPWGEVGKGSGGHGQAAGPSREWR